MTLAPTDAPNPSRRVKVTRLLRCSTALLLAWLLTSCGLLPDDVPADWVLSSPPADESLLLTVAVGVPCNDLRPIQVDESATAVTIRTTVRLSNEGCDGMFTAEDVEVVLDRPLGDRKLRGCEAPSESKAVRLEVSNPECRHVGG